MKNQERIEFVTNLGIVERPAEGTRGASPQLALQMPESGDGAVVAGGSVLAFTATLKGQARHDVLDSTLLAQLAANHAFDRASHLSEWARHYTNTLETVGWNLQGFEFNDHAQSSGTLSLDTAALTILQAVLDPTGLTVLKSTIDALRDLADGSKAIEVFHGAAMSGDTGLFQIGAASQDGNGNTSMALGTFSIATSAKKSRFLFVRWDDDQVRLRFATARAVLNERVYGVVREIVADKLAESRREIVSGIRI